MIARVHGDARKGKKTRLYNTWINMKRRCYNTNNKDFVSYGGKGITVCAEWYDYTNFKAWALANGYKDNLTIDRIDSSGDYCPENCQWLTMVENATKSHKENAKFTMNEAGEIRKIYSTGKFNQRRMAKAYGVGLTCINRIIKKITYIVEHI